MTDPLHRLKFGALSSYYDQVRAGVKWAIEEKGKEKICVLYQDNDFQVSLRRLIQARHHANDSEAALDAL